MSQKDRTPPTQPSSAIPAILGLVLALSAAVLGWKYLDLPTPKELLPDDQLIGAIKTLGELQRPEFVVPMEDRLPNMGPPPEKVAKYIAQKARVDSLNTNVLFVVLGALLSPAVVFASCCGARRIVAGLVSIPLGAVVGAAVGFAAAKAVDVFLPSSKQPGVAEIAAVEALAFGLLGGALGVVAGLFTGSPRNMFVGLFAGAIAGGLGGMAFPLVVGTLMPDESIESIMPTTSKLRLIWLAFGFGLIGLFVPAAMKAPAKAEVSARSEKEDVD